MIDSRQILLATVAVGLLVALGLSYGRLSELEDVDARLEQLDVAVRDQDLARSVGALEAAYVPGIAASERQESRRGELLQQVFALGFGRGSICSLTGRYRADAPGTFRVGAGTSSTNLVVQVQSPPLVPFLRSLFVDGKPAGANPAGALVPLTLSAGPEPRSVSVQLTAEVGSSGPVVVHRETVRIVSDVSRPSIEVRWIDGSAGTRTIAIGSTTTVSPGDRLEIEVRDGLGLEQVTVEAGTWRRDVHPSTAGPQVSSITTFTIADSGVTPGNTLSLRVVTLNDLYAESRFQADLAVREPGHNPITAITANGIPLVLGSTTLVPRSQLALALTLGAGETADGLSLRSESTQRELQPVGPDVLSSSLQVRDDQPVGIALMRGARVLATWQVQVDAAPPELVVHVGEQELAAGSNTSLPLGSIIQLDLSDVTILEWGAQEVTTRGLVSVREPRTPGSRLAAEWRADSAGLATLEVTAVDGLGNVLPKTTFEFRVIESTRFSGATLAGRPVAEATRTRSEASDLEVQITGSEVPHVVVAVWDPAATQPLSRVEWPVVEGVARGSVDWRVAAGSSQRRRLSVATPIGQSVVDATLQVDRLPPTFRLLGRAEPSGPITLAQGEALIVRIEDDDGIDETKLVLDGGTLGRRESGERFVELQLTQIRLPGRVSLAVADRAGNDAVMVVDVRPLAVPAPTIEVRYAGVPIAPLSEVDVERFSAVRVTVAGGRLDTVTIEGRPVGVDGSGAFSEVSGLPMRGEVVISATNESARSEVRFRYILPDPAVTPPPLNIDPAFVTELARLEGLLTGGASIPPEAVRSLRAAFDRLNPSPEVVALGERLRSLEAKTNRASDMAPRLTNSIDGAVLVLVPGPNPFYLYESEVTAAMFQRFVEAARSEPDFFSSIPGVPDGSGLDRALRSLVSQNRSSATAALVGITPELILAYLHWAGRGLRDGKLAIPTDAQWRAAAGGSGARYPVTTGHPDGKDLFNYREALRGAAIEARNPLPVRSFDPSPLGFYDLAGSAWEWVHLGADQYGLMGGAYDSKRSDCQLNVVRRGASLQSLLASAGFRPAFVKP